MTTLKFNDAGTGTSDATHNEATPAIVGQSFVPATDGYSAGSSVGAGGQLGHN